MAINERKIKLQHFKTVITYDTTTMTFIASDVADSQIGAIAHSFHEVFKPVTVIPARATFTMRGEPIAVILWHAVWDNKDPDRQLKTPILFLPKTCPPATSESRGMMI